MNWWHQRKDTSDQKLKVFEKMWNVFLGFLRKDGGFLITAFASRVWRKLKEYSQYVAFYTT
jgi:hypothetical protein